MCLINSPTPDKKLEKLMQNKPAHRVNWKSEDNFDQAQGKEYEKSKHSRSSHNRCISGERIWKGKAFSLIILYVLVIKLTKMNPPRASRVTQMTTRDSDTIYLMEPPPMLQHNHHLNGIFLWVCIFWWGEAKRDLFSTFIHMLLDCFINFLLMK